MNYFNNITNYIRNKLYHLVGLNVKFISNDRRNVQFYTNTQNSRSINIYRITDQNDLDNCINLIKQDLIKPAYN